MSLDLHAELAALRQLVLSSKDDLSHYRNAHSDACFATRAQIKQPLSSDQQACLRLRLRFRRDEPQEYFLVP